LIFILNSYYDGCNNCFCGDNGSRIAACTLLPCQDRTFENTCNACIDGYEPSDDGKLCVPEEGSQSCGGIENCIRYFHFISFHFICCILL